MQFTYYVQVRKSHLNSIYSSMIHLKTMLKQVLILGEGWGGRVVVVVVESLLIH